mgnify:FL=1
MRTGTIDRDGIDVHYYDVGPRGAGLTVVYAHGFNIAAEEFKLQVAEISGVRQVLVDVRGHGKTGFVAPERLTVDAAADDIAAVMRHLRISDPIITVGHSLGGPISLSLMRRHDFNWVGSVQISSTVDPFTARGIPRLLGGGFGHGLEWFVDKLPHAAEGIRRLVTDMIAPILARWFYFRPVPWDLIKFHARMIKATPLATYRGYFDDLKTHSERGAAGILSTIPGYILVGDRDNVTPVSQSAELAAIWPGAYFQVLPDSGHMPPLDDPDAVTAAIERVIALVRGSGPGGSAGFGGRS